MLRQLVFVGIAGFWVIMNVLLWRHEVKGLNLGSPVDPNLVVGKVLEAPDDSVLQIRYRSDRVGFFRWKPTVNEGPPTADAGRDFAPDGIVLQRQGYIIDAESRIRLPGWPEQLRMNAHLNITEDRAWRDLTLNLTFLGTRAEFFTDAADRTLMVTVNEVDQQRTLRVPISEMLRDLKMLERLNLTALAPLAGLEEWFKAATPESYEPEWEARSGWLEVGHTRMRVYRLHANLLGRYPVTVTISRVGEILIVKIAKEFELVNEVLLY